MTSPRIAVLLLALLLVAACGGGTTPSTHHTASSPTPTPSPVAGPCVYRPSGFPAARKVNPPPARPVTRKATGVRITTNRGAIPVTLEADQAPCTVNSFLSLAKQGYFDDTTCQRLVTAGIYILQCGDPSGTGNGGPGYQFDDELVKHDPRIQPCRQAQTTVGVKKLCTYPAGTVAMANSGPNTNGSQFFLVYRSSPLTASYTVLGRMDASGLDVVRSIARTGLAPGSQGDGPPRKRVRIRSVVRE